MPKSTSTLSCLMWIRHLCALDRGGWWRLFILQISKARREGRDLRGTAAQATQRRGRACRFSSAPRARLGDVLRPEYRPAGHVLPSVSPVGSILVRHLYTTSVAAVIVQRELPDGAVQHRLPTARRSAVARVWAWLRWGGNSTRPDLRTPGHVPSGTRAVRLEFLIRGDDVLCSLPWGSPCIHGHRRHSFYRAVARGDRTVAGRRSVNYG